MTDDRKHLLAAASTVRDFIGNEMVREARKGSFPMDGLCALADRYRVANMLAHGLASAKDPAFDSLARKAAAQVSAVRPLVTRGYGHDMSDFEMMTFLVDDAVADFARDGAPRKGMNVLAIDRSFPRAAEPAWERLAAAMDEHPGAVLNPYLERPGSLYLVMDEEDLEIMGVDPGKVYDPEELLDTWGRNLVERVECDGDLRWATLNQALYNLGMDYADVAIDDDSGEVGEPVMDPLPDRPEKGDGEAEL